MTAISKKTILFIYAVFVLAFAYFDFLLTNEVSKITAGYNIQYGEMFGITLYFKPIIYYIIFPVFLFLLTLDSNKAAYKVLLALNFIFIFLLIMFDSWWQTDIVNSINEYKIIVTERYVDVFFYKRLSFYIMIIFSFYLFYDSFMKKHQK